MARMMMTVGDFQAWIQPIVPDSNHPLADSRRHTIGFFERGVGDELDHFVLKDCDEDEAIKLMGAWMLLDGPYDAIARAELTAAFDPDGTGRIDWMLP